MNFAHVRTLIDVKDSQGFPQAQTMFGTVTDIRGEGVSQKTGKPFKKVAIRDDNGETHNVILRGTLPDPSIINQRAQFAVSAYNGNYQGKPYIGYSGLWHSSAQVSQQSAAPPQTVDKPIQQRDFDKENRGKCRFGFYQACLQAGLTPAAIAKDRVLLGHIEELVELAMNGLKPEPSQAAQNLAEYYDQEQQAEPDPDIEF